MKKKIFVALFFLLLPLGVFAVEPTSVLEGTGGLVPGCEGAFCRACDLVTLSNNVINFGIAFSVIVATLMFAYAGILYVTAAGVGAEQVKKAHKIFVNIFVGLLVVLLAWLLVNIMFSVLSGKGLADWTKIQCVANPVSDPFAQVGDPNVGDLGGIVGGRPTGTPISSPGGTLSNAEAVRRLEAAGVCGGTTGRPCLAPGVRASGARASLEGVQASTIDQAIILHNACGCSFTITSATDGVHSTRGSCTHANGCKLDIRHSDNPQLAAFVRRLEFVRSTNNWGGVPATIYKDSCGNIYAMEPTLLDLQVNQTCAY